MAERPISIYWAGDLFNFKDLSGNVELAAALGVDAIPALFFFKDGQQMQKLVGCMSKDALAAKLGL